MSRRREIGGRLAALTDIAGILSAMKSLALMETRLLSDFLDHQQRLAAGIEAAAADFLAGLTGHYLYAALNEVLYSSLMAENRQRLVHMDTRRSTRCSTARSWPRTGSGSFTWTGRWTPRRRNCGSPTTGNARKKSSKRSR